MTQYTKGKWVIRETLRNEMDKIFYHTSVISGGIRVAIAVGIGKEESGANAKLIKEAPALLDAAKLALRELEQFYAKGESEAVRVLGEVIGQAE